MVLPAVYSMFYVVSEGHLQYLHLGAMNILTRVPLHVPGYNSQEHEDLLADGYVCARMFQMLADSTSHREREIIYRNLVRRLMLWVSQVSLWFCMRMDNIMTMEHELQMIE